MLDGQSLAGRKALGSYTGEKKYIQERSFTYPSA